MKNSSLPNTYEIQKLGDLVYIKTGKLDANASSEIGEYPFFTCSITPLRIEGYSYDCECVLVAGNGDLNVKYYNGKFDAYQRTYIIESKDNIYLYTKYLYYFMSKYVNILRNQSIGGVIKYIKLGNLTEAKIPVPSLENQKKIVEVLEKAEKALEKRKEANRLLDEYLKSVFVELFGDPVKNEKGWNKFKIKCVVDKIESGWSPNAQNEPVIDGWGVLKLSAVTGGGYNENKNKAFLDGTEPKINLEVKEGDLLFTRKNTRELVGDSAYVFDTKPKLMLPDTIFRFVTKDNINKVFLWSLFNNKSFKPQITALANGSAGSMPNISKAKLMELDIICPDIEKQSQYLRIVNKVNGIKKKNNNLLIELEYLFSSLMKDVFSGIFNL